MALGLHEFGSIGLNTFGAGSLAVGPLKSARVCNVLKIVCIRLFDEILRKELHLPPPWQITVLLFIP